MNYTLVNNTPKKLNIDFKETISALINNLTDNLPVTDKNIIKVEELNQIQNKINQLYKFLEMLILANNHEFSNFHYNISGYLKNIIDKCFTRVTSFNNKTNSDEYYISSIILNGNTYKYQSYNKGNVNFGNSFISGTANDYVKSYNNLTGNVYGISGLILNNEQYVPDQHGKVTITGLIDLSNGIVTSFNNSYGIIENMLSAVTSSNNTDYITYNQNNNGIINVSDIITSLFDESLYVRNGEIKLINPSADTPPSTETEEKRVVTTEYLQKNFIKNVAGFNEIKIFENGWQISGNNFIQYISIPSGITMIRIYKITPENPESYQVNDNCSATIKYNEKYIESINILSPEKFTGKITMFQDIHQIGDDDFILDGNTVIGWNNPSKINHVTLKAKINDEYVDYYIKNVKHTDNVKCFGTKLFRGDSCEISYLDVSESTLKQINLESFGSILKLSKLPQTLEYFFEADHNVNEFEEISIWNNCKYALASDYDYSNKLNIKDTNSLHIITGFPNSTSAVFTSLIKYGQKNNLTGKPVWYQIGDGTSYESAYLPTIQSLNLYNTSGLNWYIYCGSGNVENLKNPHFDINGNNITAYIYDIGQCCFKTENVKEFHLYRNPRVKTNKYSGYIMTKCDKIYIHNTYLSAATSEYDLKDVMVSKYNDLYFDGEFDKFRQLPTSINFIQTNIDNDWYFLMPKSKTLYINTYFEFPNNLRINTAKCEHRCDISCNGNGTITLNINCQQMSSYDPGNSNYLRFFCKEINTLNINITNVSSNIDSNIFVISDTLPPSTNIAITYNDTNIPVSAQIKTASGLLYKQKGNNEKILLGCYNKQFAENYAKLSEALSTLQITNIGHCALVGLSGTINSTLTLPSSLTKCSGICAFRDCKISELYLPSTLTYFSEYANEVFRRTTIENLYIPNENFDIKSGNFIGFETIIHTYHAPFGDEPSGSQVWNDLLALGVQHLVDYNPNTL